MAEAEISPFRTSIDTLYVSNVLHDNYGLVENLSEIAFEFAEFAIDQQRWYRSEIKLQGDETDIVARGKIFQFAGHVIGEGQLLVNLTRSYIYDFDSLDLPAELSTSRMESINAVKKNLCGRALRLEAAVGKRVSYMAPAETIEV